MVKTLPDDMLVATTEDPTEVCQRLNIDMYLFHRLYLQIRGVHVEGRQNVEKIKESTMFREFHLLIPCLDKMESLIIPAKLPMMEKTWTPYRFFDGQLYFNNARILGNLPLIEIPLPEIDTPRYLKGFSYPFLGTNNPFYELRINPKNTGSCPGRCAFCHRSYTHRLRPHNSHLLLSPESVVDSILRCYGSQALHTVSRVMVITELFGNETKFLNYIKRLKELLILAGYDPNKEFGVCSQDIRTKDSLKELYKIVNPKRYSYTLEVFSKRTQIMSKYKAVPMDQVVAILSESREAGFDEIQINYVAGIDSMSAFVKGISRLKSLGVIDSIGYNVFTAFFSDQLSLRCAQAWNIEYYYNMAEYIKHLGISFYQPRSFEMGYPV